MKIFEPNNASTLYYCIKYGNKSIRYETYYCIVIVVIVEKFFMKAKSPFYLLLAELVASSV